MFGTVSKEMEVQVSATEAWELYGTLLLSKLAEKELPNDIQKIDIIQGDGGEGTILKLTFPPGTISSYKEKFTKVDNEKRVKEAELIEGAYLDFGFTLYRVRFEVIEKNENSCITRSTIEYEVKEEAVANASMVTIELLLKTMVVAANYLTKNKK
ncbi:norbelladine synthase-like [Cornus florida]|uniref:norbelladine synthase-like n=1 Tax=Cornus florida TaxID=4283 RepID=UPI0028A1CB78|nr:norbelladine synthase-like [Cornus florida]